MTVNCRLPAITVDKGLDLVENFGGFFFFFSLAFIPHIRRVRCIGSSTPEITVLGVFLRNSNLLHVFLYSIPPKKDMKEVVLQKKKLRGFANNSREPLLGFRRRRISRNVRPKINFST
ncbi:hypothetical protein Y032_0010g921 [Ancylostoma ceylanicum]|uniref:Uncharacterized protein n=1 Tax=Ancylostoma ceylanicum TaxID=53326 RepID=A0A016VI56_9BILA|nr:hypothetical protein Y032_0010g921 [Ancylostoma ceylanicum]